MPTTVNEAALTRQRFDKLLETTDSALRSKAFETTNTCPRKSTKVSSNYIFQHIPTYLRAFKQLLGNKVGGINKLSMKRTNFIAFFFLSDKYEYNNIRMIFEIKQNICCFR